MKDDDDFLDIFQDPLMTIIALVLLSTLWMLIPSGGETNAAMISDDMYIKKQEVDRFNSEISKVEQDIARLDQDISRLDKEIDKLDKKLAAAKNNAASQKALQSMVDKIELLQQRMENKLDEQKKLREKLVVAKKRQVEMEKIRQVNKEIDRVETELSASERRMAELTRQIDQRDKQGTDHAEVKNELLELKNVVLQLRQAVEKKERELGALKSENNGTDAGNGYTEYSEALTKGKETFEFSIANNKIFLYNNEWIKKNYEIERVWTRRSGIKVYYAKLTAKNYINGENFTEIDSPESQFQKELKKRDPKKEFVVFKLHSDSFKTFRKARAIASKYGFASDWDPVDEVWYVCLKPESACASGAGGGVRMGRR